MAWRLAKGLIKLREQINAGWPTRSKVSDGSVGDLSHQARPSDHNPDARGIVCAIDITKDDAHGPDSDMLSRALTTDSRVKYVIFNGLIWKARTGQWEPYHGANRHDHHVHVSIKTEAADAEQQWVLNIEIPAHAYPVLQHGARGQAVRELQSKLGTVTVDGVYGPATEAAVRALQLAHGLATTGIADGAVWKALE